jgi:hypothetical protein
MTDTKTRDLWEEKSKEFRFHDYVHSVRIADEMIRRYDGKAEIDELQDHRASSIHSDTTPNASASPNDEDIVNALMGYQPPISGEAADVESKLYAPREMGAPKISSNLPLLGDISNTTSNLPVSGEMNMSDTESGFSLHGEGARLASTERQDSSEGVSTTPNVPRGIFVLALGDPADDPIRSTISVRSGSPSLGSASFDPSVVRDDDCAAEYLEVIRDGNFVVYKEGQKEDFNKWWERTIWAKGVNDGKHRHPHWNSNIRTASVWRKFTQVANRLTGEPRMVCKRCRTDFAHPRTARRGGISLLKYHLQSIACGGAEAEVVGFVFATTTKTLTKPLDTDSKSTY